MPWDDLESDILEEFGERQAQLSGGEENLWLAQASARREHERGRKVLEGRQKAAAGECLDCAEPAVPGRRRCAMHLAARSKGSWAYEKRIRAAGYPLSEEAKIALARIRWFRRQATVGLRGSAASAASRAAVRK